MFVPSKDQIPFERVYERRRRKPFEAPMPLFFGNGDNNFSFEHTCNDLSRNFLALSIFYMKTYYYYRLPVLLIVFFNMNTASTQGLLKVGTIF